MLDFFRGLFSLEKKVSKLGEKLNDAILYKDQEKATDIFKKVFLLLMRKKKPRLLSKFVLTYLPMIEDIYLVEGKISTAILRQAVYFLEIKESYHGALEICERFGFIIEAIEIHAKLGHSYELFNKFKEERYVNKELFQAAIEYWEKFNGDIRKSQIAVDITKHLFNLSEDIIPNNPRVKEIVGQFDEAAKIFEAEGELEDAANCYEKAGMYEEASKIYEDLGENEKVSRIAELLGDFEKALKFVVKPERKFNLLMKLERFSEARKFAAGLEDPDKYFELIKEEAKRLRDIKLKSHEFIKAMELAFIAESEQSKLVEILQLGRKQYDREITKATSDEEIKTIYRERAKFEETAGNFEEAGRIAEEILEDLELAILLFEKANLINRAIAAFSKIETPEELIGGKLRLAQLHEKGGNLLKAAKLYEAIGEYERAFALYETVQNFKKAIECYLKVENQNRDILIHLYTSAGEYEKVIEVYLQSENYPDLETALSIAKTYNMASHVKTIQKKIKKWLSGTEDDLEKFFIRAKNKILGAYSTVFGIDFGTTNSVVAIFNENTKKVEIVPTPQGSNFIPSYFGMDENNSPIFGEKARLRGLISPQSVVARAKRVLGEGKSFLINNKKYRCEEIVAKILQRLKLNVEEFLKLKVETKFKDLLKSNDLRFPKRILNDFLEKQKRFYRRKDVVLTVPAYFNDNQKRATRDAAEIAGLSVKRLIHEPTAAALAYGYKNPYEGILAVIDLGGGTLDISIVDIGQGVYDIQVVGGDPKLGGSDIDAKLVQHLIKYIKSTLNVQIKKKTHRIEIARLRDACENMKINLSLMNEASLELHNFLNQPKVDFTMKRDELEELSSSILNRIEFIINKTKDEFHSTIDHFILVGNAIKMPAVINLVKRCIRANHLKGIDSGTAVATGAALKGAVLSGDIEEALLLDIVPYSLGIEALNPHTAKKEFSILIRKNSTIPITRSEMYTTTVDNQPAVRVQVYQGESNEPSKNYYLGDFVLFGLVPAPARTPQIEVQFDIDSSCILTVTATDRGTGKRQSIRIEGAVTLSPEEKRNLANYFLQSETLYSLKSELKRINGEISEIERSCEHAIRDAEQAIKEFFELFDDKINVNTGYYKPTLEQTKEIQIIIIEKDKFAYGIPKYKDLFASILNNIKRIQTKHLDFSDKDISSKLQERIDLLLNFKEQLTNLLKSIEEEALNLITKWILILKSLEPDTEKWDPLARANYYFTLGKVDTAREVLESLAASLEGLTEEAFNLLLRCYVRLGLREEYREAYKRYGFLFKLLYPDFNRLNTYLNSINESLFMIQGISQQRGPVSGSGFCIAPNLIITNRHVIEGVKKTDLKVIGKNRTYNVNEIELDPTNDLAILKVKDKLKPLRLGEFNFVEPGEQICAIGFGSPSSNVFNESVYISKGIVNSIRKTEFSPERVIFIDTKIGGGMSGSPLINDLGEVVGIITLVRFQFGQHKQGIFPVENQPIALPIYLVKNYLMKFRPKTE